MILGIGIVIATFVLLHSLFRGKRAPDNPWGGATLDWETSSPPSPHNFEKTPVAGDPYDYDPWIYDPQVEGYVKRQPGGEAETESA
jgi:cytochrome c oxidase subunit 1